MVSITVSRHPCQLFHGIQRVDFTVAVGNGGEIQGCAGQAIISRVEFLVIDKRFKDVNERFFGSRPVHVFQDGYYFIFRNNPETDSSKSRSLSGQLLRFVQYIYGVNFMRSCNPRVARILLRNGQSARQIKYF